MSLLLPETGLLFWMTLAFLVVLFILARYAFPVITRAVERRNAYIGESLDAAREAEHKLATLSEQAAAVMADARREKGELLEEARRHGKELVEQARVRADEEIRLKRENAESEIAEMKNRAFEEVRDQVVDLSVRIAEKVIGEKLSTDEQQRVLIERYMEEERMRKS